METAKDNEKANYAKEVEMDKKTIEATKDVLNNKVIEDREAKRLKQ